MVEIIGAIATQLVPAISKEVAKFWKPKQDEGEVKKQQAEFAKAAQAIRKTTLAKYAIEVSNLGCVRESFEVARQMSVQSHSLTALTSPALMDKIRTSSEPAVRSAVASELLFRWQALQPLNGRAQALKSESVDANLSADIQRNLERIQQGMNAIKARLDVPSDLDKKSVASLFAEGTKADAVLAAVVAAGPDITSVQVGIDDLAMLISVRIRAYQDEIRKATQ